MTLRGAALIALALGVSGAVLPTIAPAQDASAGRMVFAQCSSCHSTDGTNGTGPTLKGIVGRKAGTLAGFRFSRAMRNAGFDWTPQLLDAYIADPQKTLPGNLMPFSGVVDARQRADLIAYLKSLR